MPVAIVTLWRICLLRANPQDLPFSYSVLAAALVAHVVADCIPLLEVTAISTALEVAMLDTMLIVALVHTSLLLRNRGARAVQTLAAVCGSGALLGVLAWAGVAMAGKLLPPLALWVPFLLWYLAVFGHIVRHALEIPFAAAVGLGVLYFVLSSGLTGMVIGLPAAPEG